MVGVVVDPCIEYHDTAKILGSFHVVHDHRRLQFSPFLNAFILSHTYQITIRVLPDITFYHHIYQHTLPISTLH